MSVLLIDEPRPAVRRLSLNRPEARNAIDAELRQVLPRAVQSAAQNDSVRAIVLAGASGMFCAGGDLPSMVGLSREAASTRMREGHAILKLLWHCPKPVVAAVERFAIGAGAGLALVADRIVMGADATLGFPFMRLGLVPDWGMMATLPWRAGPGLAARLFADAGAISGADAMTAGVIDQACAREAVMDGALDEAERLAALPLAAFGLMKRALRTLDFNAALDAELEAQTACLSGAEFQEGFAAFREKRPPRF